KRFPIQRLGVLKHATPSAMNNIYTIHIDDVETLTHLLRYHIPSFIANSHAKGCGVRLLIIDSITSCFRFDDDFVDYAVRARLMAEVANLLKRIAWQWGVVVVVVNQVVAGDIDVASSGNEKVVPALGMFWSHMVNVRLGLERMEGRSDGVMRLLRVLLASYLEIGTSVGFEIHNDGVYGV
ncbi:hypothetical protein HK096_009030, partial [Nowakowskiella sp. JEL0078]